MATQRNKKQKCPRIAGWMTTFTDMTTLLLTFFILMFTVAEIDGYELRLILSSFTGSFGVMEGGLTLQKGPLAEMGMTVETLPSKKAANKLSKAFNEADSDFKSKIDRRIKMTENLRGYIISIPAQAYFEQGSASLTPKGKELMEKIAKLIKNIKTNTGINSQIEIEGHASREPEGNKMYRNLELSTARAITIERFFIEESGVSPTIDRSDQGKSPLAKFVVKGFGEFQPLETNDFEAGRASNRRVDIVIKRD